MELIPNWQNKNLRCAICGARKSVKYSTTIHNPVVSRKPIAVCICSRCALTVKEKRNMKYGYARVSTQDKQEFTRQEYALQEHALDRIFEEKISGTKRACGREAFNQMLELLQDGDEVYFESMSRMARSMQDLIDTTNLLVKQKKVKVVFIKENLIIGDGKGLDAMGALIFNIMGAFAQFERDLTADRTRQALAAKKAQGVVLGRPVTIDSDTRNMIISMHEEGKRGYQIAQELGISTGSVSNCLKECKNNE